MKKFNIPWLRNGKLKIALAIIGIAVGLLLTSVFVFQKTTEKPYYFEAEAYSPTCSYNHPSCGWTGPGKCRTTPPSCYASEFNCEGVCCEACCTTTCGGCTPPSAPTGYQATDNSCTTTTTSCTRHYTGSANSSCASCGTITATYYRERYAITLTANGGTGTNCKSYTTTNGPCGSTANTAFGCTRTGYTLSSYTQTGCGGTWNSSTGVCSSVTAAMSVTANWTANTYYVYYDANGGTGAPPTTSFVYNSTAYISSTIPTRTGYNFVNWTYSTYTFNPGDQIPIGWGTFTLTAQWTIKTFSVGYALNPTAGGAYTAPATRPQTINYGSPTPTATVSTNPGYTWDTFSQSGCGGTFTASTGVCSSVTAAMTITANWNINVTVNANSGTCPNDDHTRTPGAASLAPGCTRTGYTLTNYTLTGTCGGTFTASTGVCSSVTSPITVTANWSNIAPAFSVAPAEATASYSTSPTSIGASITFQATATDAINSYYLIICSTNSVTAGSGGAAPTCGATAYCTSSATTSGSQASCSYTTVSGDAWSNAWYGFVCDNHSTDTKCSAANQGSGNSGSPFYVNHNPSFTASSVSAAVNPGGTITWSTTSSDPDGNTVKLLVCKTLAMSAGSCPGGDWCTSSLVSSNASCSYVATAPYADGSYDAYPYIVDQFNLGATGLYQGGIRGFTINNVAPSVSATLNSGAAISLTESTTTNVEIVADITDDNGCLDQAGTGAEVSSVKAYLYRSGVAYTGCDTSGEANANYCYPEITCSVTKSCKGGLTSYSCNASVQYYADPTTANTLFPRENWLSTAKATDDDSDVGTGVSTGVELNTLVGGDTTPTTLDFGSLALGRSNDPLDKTLTHFPTGNVGIDITIKANTASMCTNYSTCTGGTPIPIYYQKYSLSSKKAYSSGTILTTTAVESEINIGKQTTSTAPTKQTWWGIYIPSATLPGVYNGLNVIEYVIGETSEW